MSQKVDTIQLVAREGASGDDPRDRPSQYEAGGYVAPSSAESGAAQPATAYGYDQTGMEYGRPAESYGYDQPTDGYTRPPVTQQPAPHQQTTVVMNPSPTVVVQHPAERPPDYMWLSCLVYWCCNCIVGGIAFAFSLSSHSAADEGKMEEARADGKRALGTSIVGIALGIVGFILLYFYYYG